MKKQQISVDDQEVSIEYVSRAVMARAVKTAPSLKPGVAMMEAAARGDEGACAVRDAWRFNQPIRVVTREEHARMIEKSYTTFHG